MQGVHLRKYGVEAKIPFVLYEVDGVDFRVDAADGGSDCTITKDEGAEATCDNDFVDEGTGYSITLTATEMEAARITVYLVDSATKVWLDDGLIIETYGNASAQHAFDLDTAQQSVNIAAITAGIIANASFNADVGSTAHGTNIIALACRKILEELNLDHLLKVTTGVAADSDLEAFCVAGTVLSHLMSIGADVTTFKPSTDSLEALRDRGDAAWAGAPEVASGTFTVETADTVFNLTATSGTLSGNDDAYNNGVICFYDDSGSIYEVRKITDYDGTNTRVTVDAELTFPGEDGVDTWAIYRNAYCPTSAGDSAATIRDTILGSASGSYVAQGTIGQKIHHSGKGRY